MSSPFKVIVVGGGPVGLITAHALSRAQIDFTVLEARPQIVEEAGAALIISATGLRVLGQLGLLNALDLAGCDLTRWTRIDHDRNDLGDVLTLQFTKENHGRYPFLIARDALTKVLYESLSPADQARILPSMKVCEVQTSDTGVVVKCTNGTTVEGNILIGADGAHSIVRESVRNLALQKNDAFENVDHRVNSDNPFLTTYRCMWLRFPTTSDMIPGRVLETHGPRFAIQQFCSVKEGFTAMYELFDEPTRKRSRYTKADAQAFISRWGHIPAGAGGTVQDLYQASTSHGVVDLEEGVLEHWSWDRIVLVGDAAHKFTPSIGQGANNGIIDVVVLMNQLTKVLKESQSQDPAKLLITDELTSAFKHY
ncbi:hypothetical protein PFICI_15058 [Pestalotiopsis fici W106-1]|uniref:FAD-binding domain-containing protein n=1 Tax=Pestalotiopsis fici (strain W106-1 / CGMCC3.15140) TaxID=1229662 RepID=W3WGT6_PESFW|nr:uncharacterized protein PFICI_15058 [Pestalotiopsis fici W106-1]ETS73113.1 hypothetical protein PFICI_15058 [Pestalotiopsis fici W106-1]